MSEFTQGKWKATYSHELKQYQGHEAIIHAGEFIPGSHVCTGDYIATVHKMNDARLMAHAKDMYKLLLKCVDRLTGSAHFSGLALECLDMLKRIDGEEA